VSLPNAILNDPRLSIDTRGMLAHLMSKPTTWEIRAAERAQEALQNQGSNFETAARANGCVFVFVSSEPYRAWCEYRRVKGLLPPPLEYSLVNGKRRLGTFMISLYPPGYDPNSPPARRA
jgi:hypothetical protein